jgi:hypothetical protein
MSKFKVGDIVITYNTDNEFISDIIGKPVKVIYISEFRGIYYLVVKNSRISVGHSEDQFELFWPSETKLADLL